MDAGAAARSAGPGTAARASLATARQCGFWRDRAPVLAVVALLVAGMMMGATVVWAYFSTRPLARATVDQPLNVAAFPDEIAAGTVTDVYNRVAPAVVRIEVVRVSQGLFGPQSEEGTGSGVIVDGRGYILTNYYYSAFSLDFPAAL